MGNLLSSLLGRGGECVELDFEGPSLGPDEEKIHAQVEEVLKDFDEIIGLIENYASCKATSKLAMEAKGDSKEKFESDAFESLLVAVESVSSFFKFAQRLDSTFSELLRHISATARDSELATQEKWDNAQASATQMAKLIQKALAFDGIRMTRPDLSNDFAYYRRLLPKFTNHPNVTIKDDSASGMSLFVAVQTPMLVALQNGARSAFNKNSDTSLVLAIMANSCTKMIKLDKFAKKEHTLLAASAMSGAAVVYDHISPISVFTKRSQIQIKPLVNCLKKQLPEKPELLRTIQYSSKTFRDAPYSVQDLFD